MAFAQRHEEFKALNTELLGLSIDSNYAHIAWVRNIKEKFGIDVKFPIIEDLSMNVATAYGMIQPGASDTSAVRATFIIDPEGILRAMVYYPMTNGRSIDEFVRLVVEDLGPRVLRPANLAIESILVLGESPQAGTPFEVAVGVTNHGDREVLAERVALRVGGASFRKAQPRQRDRPLHLLRGPGGVAEREGQSRRVHVVLPGPATRRWSQTSRGSSRPARAPRHSRP